jgi:hypothetical protein
MKDTYYAGYDPRMKMWSATPITHDFSDDAWVFKVAARNEHEALLKGLEQYQLMAAPIRESDKRFFQFLTVQVGKLSRLLHESMIIEVPFLYLEHAKRAANLGLFQLVNNDEILLNLSEVGWKVIQHHVQKTKKPSRNNSLEMAPN